MSLREATSQRLFLTKIRKRYDSVHLLACLIENTVVEWLNVLQTRKKEAVRTQVPVYRFALSAVPS